MASNPMQRKSRNSFLIGMVVTLFITGVIIAILLLQLGKMKNAEKQEILQRVNVYTLKQDVKPSQVLTEDMFQIKSVNKDTVPADATSDEKVIKTWFLQTNEGEMIHTDAHGLYLKRTIEQNNGIIEGNNFVGYNSSGVGGIVGSNHSRTKRCCFNQKRSC